MTEISAEDRSVLDHLLEFVPASVRAELTVRAEHLDGPLHDRIRLALRRWVDSFDTALTCVHAAGCVMPAGLTILVPARTGAGKSTLVAALAHHRGAGVIADDSLLLDGDRAIGSSLPIAIRPTSPMWPIAAALWYAPAEGRMLARADDLGGDVVTAATVGAIALPFLGRPREITPVSAATAFTAMCSMLLRPVDDDLLMEMAELTAAVPAFGVAFDSLDASLSAIDEVVVRVGDAELGDPPALVAETEADGALDETWAVRFGDDVCAIHRPTSRVAHLAGWPAGHRVAARSWAELVGSTRERA